MALVVVPMILGGSHALGRFMLIVSASLAATAWAARQALRGEPFLPRTWALVILGVGLMIPIVQLAPLPDSIRNTLSPHLTKILPLWQQDADPATRLGTWKCLSLDPSETAAGLVVFAAYSLLFIVVVGRVQTTKDLQRLLRWCGGAVLLVAMFAFVQYFFGNGKFFWFYEHPYKTADNTLKGPFPNRNHFAQFMALGIGPILIWIVSHYSAHTRRVMPAKRSSKHASSSEASDRSMRGENRFRWNSKAETTAISASTKAGQFVLAMMAGLVMFACLLSLSRGGSTALLIAILVCCGISFSVKGANRRMFGTLLTAGIILGSSLMIFGYDKVCQRLGNLTSGKVELMDLEVGRRVIWETDLRASAHFPIFGTGVGTHCDVYPIFFDHVHDSRREFSHAESGYIQTLLETGGTGALALLAAIGMVGFWCIHGLKKSRSDALRLCLAAISASIAASLFHSMTDFIWYIPGCATMTVILAACACCAHRLALREAADASQPATDRASSHARTRHAASSRQPAAIQASKPATDRSGNWLAVCAMIAISFIMIQERWGPLQAEPYWNESILADHDSKYEQVDLNTLPREELVQAADYFKEQIERLKKVVHYQPNHAHAHRELAMNYLKLFDVYMLVDPNPFSTRHLDDVVRKSEFKSKEAALEWLHRAFDKKISLLQMAQHHARCSVQACPTLGRSYLNLVELSFLDNSSFDQKMQLVDQVLLVRPQCGDSILEIADSAALSGYIEEWGKLSKRVYDSNINMRRKILGKLLDNNRTDMLPLTIAFELQQFEPDHDAALFMISRCQKRIPEVQLADLRRYCATKAIDGIEDCDAYEQATRRYVAALQYEKLDEPEMALKQLRLGYQSDPNHYDIRYSLARLLIKYGDPKEAQDHIQWCDRRRPSKHLEKMYRDSIVALDAQARARQDTKTTR